MASFLLRSAMHRADYAVARCLCLSVRLSVCLTHAGILPKQLSISKTFYTVLVLPYQTLRQYSDGDPTNGASNAGGMKNRNFLENSTVYSHNMVAVRRNHMRSIANGAISNDLE